MGVADVHTGQTFMTEWLKQDIGGCISRLVGRKRISAEWDAYDTNDVLSDEEKLCGLSDPSSDKLGEQYPKDIDRLAARLVNAELRQDRLRRKVAVGVEQVAHELGERPITDLGGFEIRVDVVGAGLAGLEV